MGIQEIIVGLLFLWAMYTLYRVLFPIKKEAGCASGGCACPSKEIHTQIKSSSKVK